MIRLATIDDLESLLLMCNAFFDSTTLKDSMEFDPESMMNTLLELMNNENALVAMAEQDHQNVGMIAMMAYPHYFAKDVLTAQELFWWVEPDYRSKGVGKELLSLGEDWATRMNCRSVTMISLAGTKVGKFYMKNGYKALENTFTKVL